MIYVIENSNKLQKAMFWKEKIVENLVTLKVYHSNQVWGNWDVPLALLERSRWTWFNEIYFLSFGLGMWELLNFKTLLSLKIQIKYKKQVLKGIISWAMCSHCKSTIQLKNDFFSYWLLKNWNTLQNNVQMLSSKYFVIGPS